VSQVRSYTRRTRSGKTIVVRSFSRAQRQRANAAPVAQRKGAERKFKQAGGQLKAGLKFGKGGRVVKDHSKTRVRARRALQRSR
jgi:hypothetical protein